MEGSLSRLKKVRRAKEKLNELFGQRKLVLLIHYSCERFVENTKGFHKVTCGVHHNERKDHESALCESME